MKEPLQFANFTWPSRWNKAAAAAMLTQSGAEAVAVGFMGTLRFRLDDPESVAAIVNHARKFADMVEQAGRDFAEGERVIEQRIEEVAVIRNWSEGLPGL
jgi:pyridoxal biosynthesis lyase PdxS